MVGSVLQTLAIMVVLLINPAHVSAQQDYFTQLENLQIGQALPSNLMQQAELVDDDNPATTYLRFESASFAYPHYVEVDSATNQVIYIELKIPDTHLAEYKTYLESLGSPEIERERTQSLILLGWPSQGVGFIVARTSGDFMLFTRYPIKSVAELIANEGSNFTPVSQPENAPEALAELTPTPIPTSTASPRNDGWDFLKTPAAIAVLLTTTVGIVVVAVIYKKSA